MSEERRGRVYSLAYDKTDKDEQEGYLHAFSVADGGTSHSAVCREATRYTSQSQGTILHTDEDKPDDLCPECQEAIEEEPPIGTPEHKEWLNDPDRGRAPFW